ncbi:ShlB/FhaC/HecB family hemolysin secretion/activation protein [Stutzerimonas kirkiae]|uniref:ShlB/FhaC/HecB family hemolysin secretion/activation protein n=1 Tax=Stutzerimonas kirkiae TaxID=2211392 RepID=UPI001A954570|nr:ShlB/FhaC/HecB family hemolysin secretion/activation protein [Stutzerimonas kirkiae]
MPIRLISPVLLLTLGLGVAHAQTLPDAGALRQQIEPERPRLPPPQAPQPPASVAPPKAQSGVQVEVSAFRFAGNSLLSDAELSAALHGYLGRSLDFDELQRAPQAVATLYRSHGWVVRAFLPRQDVTEGVVLIQVDEARFGTARIEGEAPRRLGPATWQDTIAAAQAQDEPLHAPALDRALLLLDDLPGVTASGSLAPGQQPGQTDLLLRLGDEPLVVGNIGADNFGMRGTGSQRVTAAIGVNSPLRLGDRLNAHLIHTDGNDYGRLAYSLPVGSRGLRLGANISNLDYRLVGSRFSAFDAEGSSLSWGLEASYPLLRSRQRNIYLVANADRKRFDNRANSATTAKYDVDVFTLGLIGNRYDTWGGGGSNEASLFLSSGQVDPAGLAQPRADDSDSGFTKLRAGLARHQAITGGLSAFAAWSGQWADSNLDSSERFFLGGSSGVRAYPVNEGGGSWGQVLNLELRQRLAHGWQLNGFFDYGQVWQYRHDRFVAGQRLSGSAGNRLDYKGYGLTLGWNGPLGLQLNATWAHRVGSNPNPALDGRDQDGSLNKDRFWLSASLPFEFGRTPRTASPSPIESRPAQP